MSFEQTMFTFIPLLALLCNVFLFLTFLGAKKNRLIIAFLLMLATFTAWTAGSLFMRLSLWPGYHFWYEVSVAGVFCVPFLLYNFLYYFTNQKGTFVRNLLFFGWLAVLTANFLNVFIQHPLVMDASGKKTFSFHITPWAVIPILFAAYTLFLAARMVYRSIKKDGASKGPFIPLAVGVIIMFMGVIADVIPGLESLPNDTFVCGLNALCLYYALYKKRLITLTSLTSGSPVYLLSAVFTSLLLLVSYPWADRFFTANFSQFLPYKTFVFAVVFSLLTMVVYTLIKKLMNNLFIKNQVAREADLKAFSRAINKTLDIEEIVKIYQDFIRDNMSTENAYICVLDEKSGMYDTLACTQSLRERAISLAADNPLVKWLEKNNQGITYREFQRTSAFRSMWESEKDMFARLGIELIIPMTCDDSLIGITFFTGKNKSRSFTYGELNFLESVSAILSIAFKNAMLYSTMQSEARMDGLTGLYNRRHFLTQVKKDFELAHYSSFALLLINFDDFKLYNELYGTYEGDRMLERFAQSLKALIGERGMAARYGGKEFMVSLPFGDAALASQLVEQLRKWLDETLEASAEKTRCFLTFSAGICVYPVSASSLDELITNVNMAVYTAKKNGKNRTVVYTAGQKASERNSTKAALSNGSSEDYTATIYALTAAINTKDHYTFDHSNHVSEYAAALAEAIGLDAEHVEIVRQAGLLHDIGKIGIPESILSKTGALTDEEYEIMKQHVELSISMIRYLPNLDYVIPTAIGHHERWDGKGYPRGIAGKNIPIGARCLCIADAFDAMVSKRSYKEPLRVDQALNEIRVNLGRQFDPKLGSVFIRLVEEHKIPVS